jgi:hypothetical protein
VLDKFSGDVKRNPIHGRTQRRSRPQPYPSLFDNEAGANASALVTVTPRKAPLSAAQRTFNRLTERVRRGRASIAAWEAFIPRFQGRVAAELGPKEDAIVDVQRQVVVRLQTLLAGSKGERLSRRQCEKARALLLQIIDNLLEEGPDAELEALYDRHSDVSYAERTQGGHGAGRGALRRSAGAARARRARCGELRGACTTGGGEDRGGAGACRAPGRTTQPAAERKAQA